MIQEFDPPIGYEACGLPEVDPLRAEANALELHACTEELFYLSYWRRPWWRPWETRTERARREAARDRARRVLRACEKDGFLATSVEAWVSGPCRLRKTAQERRIYEAAFIVAHQINQRAAYELRVAAGLPYSFDKSIDADSDGESACARAEATVLAWREAKKQGYR